MMSAIVEIDLHGLNLEQAREALDDILRRVDMSVYRVRVIHGYHGGTALKEMIYAEYKYHYKVLRLAKGASNGQTDLVLREY